MSMDREGVQWTDAQQRAGFILACRTLLALAALIAGCALVKG